MSALPHERRFRKKVQISLGVETVAPMGASRGDDTLFFPVTNLPFAQATQAACHPHRVAGFIVVVHGISPFCQIF